MAAPLALALATTFSAVQGPAAGVAARSFVPVAASRQVLFGGRVVQALASFSGSLYAGTDGGLMVSRRGGPWAQVGGPLQAAAVNALVTAGGVLFAAYDGGVLATRDGETWSGPTLQGLSVDSLASSGASVFAGTGSRTGGNGSAYRSDDGGLTWQPAVGAPLVQGLPGEMVQAIMPTAAGPVLAGTAGGGIYRSRDGRGAWAGPAGGVDYPWITSFTTAADGSLLAGTDNLLYRSTDGGASWSAAAFPEPYPWVQALAQGDGAVALGTLDGAVYAGGPGARGGPSWHSLATGLPEVLSLLALGGGQYLAGTGDGLLCLDCAAGAAGRATAGPGAPASAPSLPPPASRPGAGAGPAATAGAGGLAGRVTAVQPPSGSLSVPPWLLAGAALVAALLGLAGAWLLRVRRGRS